MCLCDFSVYDAVSVQGAPVSQAMSEPVKILSLSATTGGAGRRQTTVISHPL